jgi:8-oxo-dGTP pyrophosphatase MutT (NUDIX family)
VLGFFLAHGEGRIAMNQNVDEGANPYRVKATKVLHRDDWLSLEANDVVRPDGSDGAYNVVRVRRLGVGVLPIDAEGCVHMIGQWRFPIGRYSWEMPAGGAEAGEDALSCAKRELAEETGLHAADWIKILELDLSTSLTDERSIVFIATRLEAGPAHPEPREATAHRRAHFLDLVEQVGCFQIREGATAGALLRAYHMAATGLLPDALARAMIRGAR